MRRPAGAQIRSGRAAILAVGLVLSTGCSSSHAHDTGSTRMRAGRSTPAAPLPSPRRSAAPALKRITFYSPVLHRRDYYLIHLPPGYTASARRGTRFPVLYLLHGDGIGIRHMAIHMFEKGRVGSIADHLVTKGQIKRFLIVMPEADDGTRLDDMEWVNTASGAYEREVTDLVRKVDARWRTIPNRSARAIAGLSMGGYGAVNVALHNPQLFQTVESWSGYFTQTRDAVFAGASRAQLRADSPAAYVPAMGQTLQRLPMRFLLYGGINDPFTKQQAPFAAELRALGLPVHAASFPGPHDYILWRKRMPLALRFASQGLGSPR